MLNRFRPKQQYQRWQPEIKQIMKRTTAIAFLLFAFAFAPDKEVAHWNVKVSKKDTVSEEVEITFTATIKKSWYLYSSQLSIADGPIATHVEWAEPGKLKLVDAIQPINPSRKYDQTWEAAIDYFEKKAQFKQRLRIDQRVTIVEGFIVGQYCNEKSGECIPFRESFKLNV